MTVASLRFFNLSEPMVPMFRDLFPALLADGYEVEVVLSRSTYRSGWGVEPLRAAVPGISIVVTPGASSQFSGIPGARLISVLAYWVLASLRIVFGRSVDANVFLTQPPCFFGLGLLLARFRTEQSVVIVMDDHPRAMSASGAVSSSSLLFRLFDQLTNSALRSADVVIAIGRCMEASLPVRGVDPNRIQVIQNWIDDSSIQMQTRKPNVVRDAYGWDDDTFVVMYGGNIGHAQRFDELLAVADQLDPTEGIVIVVNGAGSEAGKVRSALDTTACGMSVDFLHERFELSDVLAAADVHFITLRERWTGLGVPSKLYSAMAAGRPTIFQGSPHSEVAIVLAEHGIGIVVPSNDAESLLEAIRTYARDPERCTREGCEARRVMDSRFGAKHGVDRYRLVFRNLRNGV